MPVPNTISDLSTSALLNSPAGTDSVSNTLDDYLRATQAILKSQFAQGTSIAVTGSTITLPETGSAFLVSSASAQTVTNISSNFAGRVAVLQFQDSNINLIDSGSLWLPFSNDFSPATGDVLTFVSRGSGIWQCVTPKVVPILLHDGSSISTVKVY